MNESCMIIVQPAGKLKLIKTFFSKNILIMLYLGGIKIPIGPQYYKKPASTAEITNASSFKLALKVKTNKPSMLYTGTFK